MSNVFNITRLAGGRALVQGTDEGETAILCTDEFDRLKGNTALKDAINEVLATMTTDDYNTMMDEAISVQPLSE